MTRPITTIGFDADDTLWHNESVFRLTQEQIFDMLSEHADPDTIGQKLLEAERRNLGLYGFGVKGFTLSMIETAIEVTSGKVPASTIKEILEAGRAMLSHPVETLPGVHDTLEEVAPHYSLILITKGDLFDQERKLAQSGLGDWFDGVEIVSDKTPAVYERIFGATEGGPAKAMMVGNSLKSDVIPAIEAGSWGVHVPHGLTWELERAEPPEGAERFRKISSIERLPALLESL
ncbi:HAD family hydrolase [Henriciella mobilis]|uniref:HAD family hydrolase n=1 Tax=Henriciella mobilis TaxID=2305467 RepID=A0A399RAM9_9PROT|nr:HAD family hydrolase [Henriciella mobilis]RIJ14974.1 HAD family hydrolase [Henriciella mobilis]RIJ21930.1 HAD family hydrolase [Henriciella mobilis]RIJ26995.1 HAD family hydrolase [Henriciella mobilis]